MLLEDVLATGLGQLAAMLSCTCLGLRNQALLSGS